MRRLIICLLPFFLIGCVNSSETKERDILYDVTGVWSEETIRGAITVYELNFDTDSLKTLKLIHTPSELDRKWKGEVETNILYDVSIKNINKENNTVSFYLTKKGENFKEPMRANPIWTIRQYFSPEGSFKITLITDKGESHSLGWVRDY